MSSKLDLLKCAGVMVLGLCSAVSLPAARPRPWQRTSAEHSCLFTASPRVIWSEGDPHQAGSGILQIWETANDPVLWAPPKPPGPWQGALRQRLKTLGVDWKPETASEGLPSNTRVSAPNCLETLLLTQQDARLSLATQPAEFVGFVFRSPDERHLRVYFYTLNEPGISHVEHLLPVVSENRDVGWPLLGVLHNHPFRFTGGNDGSLAPDRLDRELIRTFAEDYQLQALWITNGLGTARIPAVE